MSVPRYKAKQAGAAWDVLDLAADGKVILCCVPESSVIDLTEALNKAYETGVEDGTASERIGSAGRLRPDGYGQQVQRNDGDPRNNDPANLRVADSPR
jgi:hypothetical protein